jgi:hypothetical protein
MGMRKVMLFGLLLAQSSVSNHCAIDMENKCPHIQPSESAP